MAGERVDAAAGPHIPHLYGVVEGAGDDALALCIEVQRDHLRGVPQKHAQAFPAIDIPEPNGVVHRSGGDDAALRVERETDDLRRVATVLLDF